MKYRELTRTQAIDRYIKLEARLERATSKAQEEKLIHDLGSLEIIYSVTPDDVLTRKASTHS